MTQTIAGPLRGVIIARPATLEVREMMRGRWNIIWVQAIKEDAGWDELITGSPDKSTYTRKDVAEIALAALKATNPTPPG